MMKKRVLVACGAGIATSTIVNQRIEDLLANNGIDADLKQIKIVEAKGLEGEADLIVSTTIAPTTYSIPIVIATSYITGIGMEAVDQQILDALK
ncbi:PTS system D-arabitol-specific IIB component (Gat family) [Vagococcus fluvialis]|jgi:PTS system galactitol-specific IIB component|nr:PTS sugar transporter subunit IIB [Vagococcus fluvialis]MDR2277730.1 PTS sugar transporter subunit IIB [Vagococcus sp.]RCX12603.1 PTS system D-arabitol-specific IIB component (Gat family) [Vagococcus fluvialis]UDM80284.1 PTS sugar transporter subunit IIB [Vagococcus fluvialis]